MPFDANLLIDIPLLALLACTAVTVARTRDLWAAAMLTGIYSFLGAGLVQAEDVTELMLYVSVPVLLMLAITGAMFYFRSRYAEADPREVIAEE